MPLVHINMVKGRSPEKIELMIEAEIGRASCRERV